MAPLEIPALLSLVALSCAQAPPPADPPATPAGPDILLVTIDTLRADRVGAYGDPLAATPQLDALAAEGALFREAIAVAPLTLPSHASMLSGLYPAGHGLRDNGGFRLEPSVPLLAERLSDAGYRTAAFVSAYVLDAAWGLDRGFDQYRAPFHPRDVAEAPAFGALEVPGADTVNAAVAFLREQGDGPRFCWVHLYDPHTPWAEHPGWEGDPYRGEVAFADQLLGRLLRAVDRDDLVIVTSDHGEGLWDHGEREHGLLLARSTTRVPLVVRPPGGLASDGLEPRPRPVSGAASRRPGGVDLELDLQPVPDEPRAARVVEQPVSGVDIAPTIADYAGLEAWGDGVSLRPALEGGQLRRGPVYSETFFPRFHYGWSELLLVQRGDERLRLGPSSHLLDLQADPAELRFDPVSGHALEQLALGWAGSSRPEPGPVPADAIQKLAALGYVEAVQAPLSPRSELADPRERMQILARLHALEGEADPAVAVAGLRALVDSEPGLVEARLALAQALRRGGQRREALSAALSVLDLQPRHSMALSNAAGLCRELGEHEQGLELARRLQALNPQDPRGHRLEVVFWVDSEEPQEVIRASRAGLAVAPQDPQLLYLLGLALVFTDRYDEAVQALEAAREQGSRAGDISLYLGMAHDRAGRVDPALAAYREYAERNPDDLRGQAAAAWMLYKADDCVRAAPYLGNLRKRGADRDPRVKEAWQACAAPGGP